MRIVVEKRKPSMGSNEYMPFYHHENGAQLILVNNCNESIWPGILGTAGLATPQSGGKGGVPPATVVEMTLGSSTSPLHFYDVSLVDGFNLPVSMKPVGGGIGCGVASCEVDLNVCCPSALEVRRGGRVVGCKSACLAMQSAKYCCTGSYANPNTCKPTLFAHLFKAICPKAYSYAFDDSSSLNKCRASRLDLLSFYDLLEANF
ncbi:Pathogenesis-related thaumatin superfamily protein [Prunus dulcis]|uniref:Pathogenesis-related thaumatin superfamily protein n=1 Tax=Prunus dulcis TaxID=3755 RepID=A0A4Y1RQN2_PRUDU|nr:Pathogenesis-related thaumatin superfamily protein [Prunus dulcis]